MSMTSFPAAIVARTTLLESDAKSIVTTSEIVWAGILAAIVEQKGGDVAILDLNALRIKYGGKQVPSNIISEEIASEKWDIIYD